MTLLTLPSLRPAGRDPQEALRPDAAGGSSRPGSRRASLKDLLAGAVRQLGRWPAVSRLLAHPDVRRRLASLPGSHLLYGGGWGLVHPFDTTNGTETSGVMTPHELPRPSPLADTNMNFYCGSQPSIVRTALGRLPALERFTFIDIGAGKGRPLLVAAERPFREVVGVELSAALADRARRNGAIFRRRHPACAPIRIETGDALQLPLGTGDLVLFLYNPFGEALMRRLVARLEAALATPRSLFVIYYNPVYGACFDASPLLARYDASTIPYAAEERGFGPDTADPVVIWQGGSALPAHPGAEAAIRITQPGIRCELVPSAPAG